ncbi:MAG: hypothetical protein E7402_05650 [Ruminococcaceae bacterium]|nr:hypothetical protein [Oscillospiraceae bacterium]
MSFHKKTTLFMFVDYGICFLLQFFGLYIMVLVQNIPWGPPLYSILFCAILFIFHYVRTNKAARHDLTYETGAHSPWTGLFLALPLVVLHLIIIGFYALIQTDFLPLGDIVIRTVYEFPDNAPRQAVDFILLDYATPVVRLWFFSLLGFTSEKTSALLLLIVPVLTLIAGWTGYLAGLKNFSALEAYDALQKKLIKKFND